MGFISRAKRCQMWKEREKRLVSGWVMLALPALLVSLAGVSAITTTEPLVESTHTPLPVTLGELALDTSPASADLSEAETKDPQRLEIIKQIRKVNQDGSYTVGYEAEDGTFKIESRDVLGNIKGTYGYIDVNGDIKRVSYGGNGPATRPSSLGTTVSPPPSTTEEDVVHIPPRFNRSQQHQLLVPTTRRPPNYHPPQHHLPHLQHHIPQHASTLRPSVIQTIPRKRPGYPSSTTTTTTTTAAVMGGSSSTVLPAAATTTATTSATPISTRKGATESASSAKPTAETGGHLAASFGEPTTASSHTSAMHSTRPQSTLLIIRPTPLPYQAGKTAEQLARPERLDESGKHGPAAPSKKPVRGNFLRRQLAAPAAAGESGEQFEAQQQQQQQIVYDQSETDGELGGLFTPDGGKPLYTTHPTPRIPAAVLAARQRAANIQSLLHAQAGHGGPAGERLGKERTYVKQPARLPVYAVRHEPAPILYEPSTEPNLEHGYVTDGPGSASVGQSPAANRVATAAATETESDAEERRPIFRPRPIEFRPREAAPQGRYRTPYGLPPPFARSFTPLPPSQELSYSNRVTERTLDDRERDPDHQQQLNSLLPYRQQRRLSGGLPLPAADSGYAGPQQPLSGSQQQQQQQQQQQFPIPVSYNPAQYPTASGRASVNPYYYDIPAERPLTARDFERILQLLIFRHQQLQQVNQRYRGGGGGYYGGYNGGYPYNPYFPGPSPSLFGLGNPYLGGGYPQQQIPRPPLPYPYGSPYDGPGYQNPLYSPSAPSSSMHAGPPDGGHPDADGGYGQPAAARRHGQYLAHDGSTAGSGAASGSQRPAGADYLPPEVRESLLYRMLMLAIQTSGPNEALPLASPTGSGNSQLPHLHHLQGASSVPRPLAQPNLRAQNHPLQQDGPVTAVSSITTVLPMFSKKPVRSVQILGEE